MTTTAVENLPATWDDTLDLPFFRITNHLFTPEFCFGAGVLLASYDDDTDVAQPTPSRTGPGTAAPSTADDRPRPGRDLEPVRVRRAR